MIAAKIQQQCNQEIEGAIVSVFRAPPIQGLGNAGGFKLQTEQRGYVDLERAANDDGPAGPAGQRRPALMRASSPCTGPTRRSSSWTSTAPRSSRSRCRSRTSSPPSRSTWAGYYVNQFNKFGRTWQVNIQADPDSRTSADILKQL